MGKKNAASDLLVTGMSKQQVLVIARQGANDEAFFTELMDAIRSGERTPAMKAAWILGAITDIDQTFSKKNSKEIFQLLKEAQIGGVERELMKVLMDVSLDEDTRGKFIDHSFRLLMKADSDVAVKYNAIKVIERSLKIYPELKSEFIDVLESQLEIFTDAGKRYIAKLLGRLRK